MRVKLLKSGENANSITNLENKNNTQSQQKTTNPKPRRAEGAFFSIALFLEIWYLQNPFGETRKPTPLGTQPIYG